VRQSFFARQLLEVEAELTAVSKLADEIGMTVGELSDEIHYDGAVPRPVDQAIADVKAVAARVNRAFGMLQAYQLMWGHGKETE